jgi:hypothetical protein
MQAPTHILAGVLIQKAFESKKYPKAGLALTAVCAFLSHGILDKLADLTYHRAQPDFQSAIWVGYHLALIGVTVLFLYWWWKPYKWGIIFACLPDLDWVFIHGQKLLHVHLSFYSEPHLHHLLRWILRQAPGFQLLDHLPNFRNNPWAILPEAAVVFVVAIALRSSPAASRTPATGQAKRTKR